LREAEDLEDKYSFSINVSGFEDELEKATGFLNRAKELRQINAVEPAELTEEKAIDALNQLGAILEVTQTPENIEKAIECFNKALELNPEHTLSLKNLREVRKKLKELKQEYP